MFFLRRCGKFCQRWSKGGATFHSPVTCRPFGKKCEIHRSPVRKFRSAPVFHKFSYIATWIILYQNTLLSSESCQKSPHRVRNVFLLHFSNLYIENRRFFKSAPQKLHLSPVCRHGAPHLSPVHPRSSGGKIHPSPVLPPALFNL